jgi:hypothetical protein
MTAGRNKVNEEWRALTPEDRRAVPGKVWRSGAQAYTYTHDSGDAA